MPYREIKVIDIAREAKTSPATFYQYFPDIESAVLALAEATNFDTAPLSAIVRDRSWRGARGYDVARDLVDALIEFWEGHRAILRVVDLLVAEDDLRFRAVRHRLLNDLAVAMTEVIVETQGSKSRGMPPEGRIPMATAGVLVAMLANVATHRYTYEFWGIPTAELRRSMADIVYTSLTGKVPPKGAR
jgi:AcrR family transcriptional regulator